MAAWGALGGLGAGLQELGTTVYKSELAKKLEAQRMEQEEARLAAKEERADRRLRSRPDPSQSSFIERDGALFKQQRNVYGDVLDEALASADDIDKRNYTKQKQENELNLSQLRANNQGLTNELLQSKVANADSLAGLEKALKQSTIERNNKQGDAALIRANRTGTSTAATDKSSAEDYAALLRKEAKDVIDQYQQDDETLTATEVNEATRQAVQEAAKFGLDPRKVLEQILEERNFGKPIAK